MNSDNTDSNNGEDNNNAIEIGSGSESIKINFDLNDAIDGDDNEEEEEKPENMTDFLKAYGGGKLPSEDDDDEIDANIDFSDILKNYS